MPDKPNGQKVRLWVKYYDPDTKAIATITTNAGQSPIEFQISKDTVTILGPNIKQTYRQVRCFNLHYDVPPTDQTKEPK
jgi:hypothetical protein